MASMSGRAEMAVYRGPDRIALAPGDDPPMASVEGASASYFRVLGLRPALGRFYTTEEDALESPAPVAVVSDAFWRRELDGDTPRHRRGRSSSAPSRTRSSASCRRRSAASIWMPSTSGAHSRRRSLHVRRPGTVTRTSTASRWCFARRRPRTRGSSSNVSRRACASERGSPPTRMASRSSDRSTARAAPATSTRACESRRVWPAWRSSFSSSPART